MLRPSPLFTACLALACFLSPAGVRAAAKPHPAHPEPFQETGFLNRKIELHGVTYRFQVYLPEDWRRDDHKQWPILLFLHGRGERGSEGMWQTQIGLAAEVRDHPERWPFVIVMPQCPQPSYWTDQEMQALAMAAFDQEAAEFHTDPERTYLTGISLGGYGAWELTRTDPHRWAAIAIASSGVFWSYAPERWQQMATLPAEYAHAVGKTPVWLFHGAEDNVVPLRESELMYDALKASGGRVRLWIYQGLKHDSWTRAFNEPELPHWLLAHRAEGSAGATAPGEKASQAAKPPAEPAAFAERVMVPLHPPALKLTSAQLDALTGDYRDQSGRPEITVIRQGDQLYMKNRVGEIDEMAAETPSIFFYPNGSSIIRLTFERDARHEERWEKHVQAASR